MICSGLALFLTGDFQYSDLVKLYRHRDWVTTCSLFLAACKVSLDRNVENVRSKIRLTIEDLFSHYIETSIYTSCMKAAILVFSKD